MSTGIETWNMSMLDIGPMYPFPGTEVLWVILGLASWILWHWLQARMERRVFDEDEKLFDDSAKLTAAMEMSNAETLIESLKVHANNMKR